MSDHDPTEHLRNVFQSFPGAGGGSVEILHDINLEIDTHEVVAIVHTLKQSARNEVGEAVVLSQLAFTFSHERPQPMQHTVVAWARDATLFKCSIARQVFHGLQQPAATP